MAKKVDSEKLQRSKDCVDQIVNSWNRTYLTDIEKYFTEERILWGVFDLALFLLSPGDYQELKNYTWIKYGYNIGGAIGEFKGEEADAEET